MRRGLIAIDEVKCDSCGRTIRHPERYLAIDEDDRTMFYCTDCCLKKGYAHRKVEKGEEVLTFFPD